MAQKELELKKIKVEQENGSFYHNFTNISFTNAATVPRLRSRTQNECGCN